MLHLHPSITPRRVEQAAHLDNGIGFCIACGKRQPYFVEADAAGHTCGFPRCAKATVYGADELLQIGVTQS